MWISWSLLWSLLFLKSLFISALNKCNFDPIQCCLEPGFAWIVVLKKTEIEFKSLKNISMSIMNKSGIKGGVCHFALFHAKANDNVGIFWSK